MARSRAARLQALEQRYDPAHRYVDIAVQFHACELANDELVWTDRASRIYGGRWDKERLEYVDPGDAPELGPLRVLHLECSDPQFEYVESDARETEFEGGRGLGKSYGGLLVGSKNICNRPFVNGRLVSPTVELYIVQWDKIVPQMLASGWLLDGEDGVKEARHELWFWNGVVVQFRSGHKPGRLASWGGGWAIVDESQDVSDKAITKLLFCLREGRGKKRHGNWQLYHQLTPAPGEALRRHDEHVAAAAENPADAKVIHAESRANLFTDHDVFDFARRRMSRDQYAIEVLGDWETVRRLEESDSLKPVFRCLVPEYERYEAGERGLAHEWPVEWEGKPGDVVTWDGFVDVTALLCRKVLGHNAAFAWKYIAGLDPGTNVPNACTLSKVFLLRRAGGAPWTESAIDFELRAGRQRLTWVAWDFFEELGHCGHMGQAIREAGYAARDVCVVPDFTAWSRSYLRQPDGSGIAKKGFGPAAARMLQEQGFYVVRRANSLVAHSVQDALAKLDPAEGGPLFYFRLPTTVRLFQNMASVLWNKQGKDFDPSVPNDPTDSCRYPISFFDPAARFARNAAGAAVVKKAS